MVAETVSAAAALVSLPAELLTMHLYVELLSARTVAGVV
jgi:hypothetical protein